jgi:hypothetical protein
MGLEMLRIQRAAVLVLAAVLPLVATSSHAGEILQRETFIGAWNGLRADLSDRGIAIAGKRSTSATPI